ncbi:MAG: hypothetical protein IPG39_06380 [Bacteroidetes bacterium]|nr:hypothetical protein [Bacteroidota bacterium]
MKTNKPGFSTSDKSQMASQKKMELPMSKLIFEKEINKDLIPVMIILMEMK